MQFIRYATVLAFGLGVVACGDSNNNQGGGGGGGNTAPIITSSATANVNEGAGGTVYTITATDADGDVLTFSISGADAGAFVISGANISFATPPNFEAPQDTDLDNVYVVTVRASDGTATATLTVNITVNDRPESYELVRVADSIAAPLFLAPRPGMSDVFVTERAGRIRILNPDTGVVSATPFLDISTEVGTAGEGGFLGFATAPDYAASGVFYVHITNLAGNTEVRRYVRDAGNPDIADPASGDIIFTVGQPDTNHNGGWIGFGADDMLYIALGDGGGGGDPFGNGQNTNSRLGALLRIDPTGDDFPADPDRDYAIPLDNPLTGGGAPEIWAYGLRNPFRASVDHTTGDIYIGDVGQNAIEEIDLAPAGVGGLNFGWPVREGTQSFSGPDDPSFTPPIAEYSHGTGPREGRSVTGGYVYRGPIAELQGFYFFADFISNNVWSIPVASITQGSTVSSDQFVVETQTLQPTAGSLSGITSFGEDDAGNLYIVTIGGDIFRIEAAP